MKSYLLIGTCLVLGGMGTYVGRSLLVSQAPGDTPTAIPRVITSYRDIVKKVLPAVVSLEAQAKGGKPRPKRTGDMQLPDDLRRFFDSGDGDRRIDDERSQVGFGSGFLISPKGVIVTNNHVVEGADQVLVQMASGKKFIAKKIFTDVKTDMAILQLDVKEALPYLEFGDSDLMEIGDRVLAVGAPFGLAGTVTQGIISSKGRSLKMNMYEDFLQTDAAINPGNSGGPLVNLEGKVIGINSAIKSRSGGFQGVGLAIASNLGKVIAQKLLDGGVVKRGYLGVGIRDVNEETAKELQLDQASGVEVTRLYRDAPGEKAGLEKGDVIVTLGGKRVKDSRGLQTVVAGLPTGKPVDIEVIRAGRKKKLSVTIEEQPEKFGTSKAPDIPEEGKGAVAIAKLGFVVADLSDDVSEALGYPASLRGVLITRIDRRGLAGMAGLKAGWVVLSVDKKPVTMATALVRAVEDGSTKKGIVLQVRGLGTESQRVTLRDVG